jgi:beta-lactamase class A
MAQRTEVVRQRRARQARALAALVGILVVASVTVALVVTSGPSAASAKPVVPRTSTARGTSGAHDSDIVITTTPFDRAVTTYLSTREGVLTAAIYDENNGQTWTLNRKSVQQTASIAKVDIMAAVFYDAEQKHWTLSASQQDLLSDMIEWSDNSAASALYQLIGTCSGLRAFNALIPLHNTNPLCPVDGLYGWGSTTTTALDQSKIVRLFADTNHLLTTKYRKWGLSLMTHISSYDTWGITAGPTKGTTVAFKNGWVPLTSDTDWQINSIGWIDGAGRDYVIAVLTDSDPSENYGQATIEGFARIIWREMGRAPYGTG